MSRPDDPIAVQAHKDRFYGGKALVILGGSSGASWRKIKQQVKPDVILTANGNTDIPDAEYWILAENMEYQHAEMLSGSKRGKEFMRMVNAPNTAKFRLVSHRTWKFLENTDNTISIRRTGWEFQPDDFNLREYGEGFFYGTIFSRPECVQPGIRYHVGTVACHMLHLAGILGCFEVHTIGMDLCFKGEKRHHWYKHPEYKADRFRTSKMFVDYEGIPTQWGWIDGASFLKSVEWLFHRDELHWIDHSDGLLKVMGLECAQ